MTTTIIILVLLCGYVPLFIKLADEKRNRDLNRLEARQWQDQCQKRQRLLAQNNELLDKLIEDNLQLAKQALRNMEPRERDDADWWKGCE